MAKWELEDGLIIELNKCPFCGEEEIRYEFNWGKYGEFAKIRCAACGAMSRAVRAEKYRHRQELEAAWNRRCEK